jgi:hypothetical protein
MIDEGWCIQDLLIHALISNDPRPFAWSGIEILQNTIHNLQVFHSRIMHELIHYANHMC